jgi:hypothetical protein
MNPSPNKFKHPSLRYEFGVASNGQCPKMLEAVCLHRINFSIAQKTMKREEVTGEGTNLQKRAS